MDTNCGSSEQREDSVLQHACFGECLRQLLTLHPKIAMPSDPMHACCRAEMQPGMC